MSRLFGVRDGDPCLPPPDVVLPAATEKEIRQWKAQHAEHGCDGSATPVMRGNILTGYYPTCPKDSR